MVRCGFGLPTSLRSLASGAPEVREAAGPPSREWALAELVDLERYPILEKGGKYEVLAGANGDDLAKDGFCVLRGFLRPAAVQAMLDEISEVGSNCFIAQRKVNPWGESPEKYASAKSKTIPEQHPKRKGLDSTTGVITCNELATAGPLRTLYAHAGVLELFTRIAGTPIPLCHHADELAACTASIFDSGHIKEWSFVPTPLEATVFLQAAAKGGEVEVLPRVFERVEAGDEQATEVLI